MQILKITKEFGIDDIEAQYRHLKRWQEFDTVIDILIPVKFDNNFIGITPALLQFVLTWSRYTHSRKLLLDIDDPSTHNWDEIFESEHIYPIVGLVINRNGVFNSQGNIKLNDFLRTPFSTVRTSMVKVRPWKGGKMLLTSIDHFPEEVGLLPCFETPGTFLNNEATIARNLKPAFETILNFIETKENFKPLESEFIGIIHELMKNTWEWARTDKNNVPLDPSIRGLFVRFHRRNRSIYTREALGHNGIRNYFESPILKENGNGELYLLEISVFDSGVGFVNKFNGFIVENENDVDIIKRCLIKHQTSAKGLEKSEKGIGLDRILKILNRKGFLRIKTNRSCIYRNLISHPYKPVTEINDMELFDWDKDSSTSFSIFPNAEGSVITILFPLAINFI